MDGFSIQKGIKRSIQFFLGRIIFLFVIFLFVFYGTVNQHTLNVKTINFLMPEASSVKKFNEYPELMIKEELTDLLNYYQIVCHIQRNDPEHPAPCSFAAYAYYYLNQKNKAIAYYKKSLNSNPYFFWAKYNLAVIHYNDGLYQEAANEFKETANLPVDNSMYFMLLTKTYKDTITQLKLDHEGLYKKLLEGYQNANKLSVVSNLLATNSQLKEQMTIKKLKLQLF